MNCKYGRPGGWERVQCRVDIARDLVHTYSVSARNRHLAHRALACVSLDIYPRSRNSTSLRHRYSPAV